MPSGRARRAVLPCMPFEHGAVRCSTLRSGNSLARLRSLPCFAWRYRICFWRFFQCILFSWESELLNKHRAPKSESLKDWISVLISREGGESAAGEARPHRQKKALAEPGDRLVLTTSAVFPGGEVSSPSPRAGRRADRVAICARAQRPCTRSVPAPRSSAAALACPW